MRELPKTVPEPKRSRNNDGDSSSSDSEDASLQGNVEQDSDSSSSSDGTQIWVPFKSSAKEKDVGRMAPYMQSGSRTSTLQSNTATPKLINTHVPKRNSIVSHSSVSGKIETTLSAAIEHMTGNSGNGDSGISNDSPPPTTSRSSRPPSYLNIEPAAVPRPVTPPATPLSSILKNADQKSPVGIQFRDCFFNITSSLYAIALVVLGTVMPITEIFAHAVPYNLYEAFYIYLYGIAILFLVYVYAYLLRNKTVRTYRKQKRKKCEENGLTTHALMDKPRKRKIGVIVGTHHTGSFYLRVGSVAFGIGSMIHDGLKFSEVFDMEKLSPCTNILVVVRPMLHLGFTFIQLYFVFLNSKMCIHKFKTLARFGLMHMIATNLCVLSRVTIKEILRDYYTDMVNNQIQRQQNDQVSSYVTDGGTANTDPTGGCRHIDLMGATVEQASPYLYPMTIQYSLITTGILYIMWRNIGSPLTRDAFYNEDDALRKKRNRVSVDCHGSNKGLFFGILVFVGGIVSLIVFYVLVRQKEFVGSAIVVVYSSEIGLYFLTGMAAVFAFVRMRDMQFLGERDNSLDESLLLISTTGVYVYAVFGVLAGRYHTDSIGGLLMLISAVMVLVQSTIQTVFIFNGLRRVSTKASHEQSKPGREFVTFLLVCNLAMWGMNTFEKMRLVTNPVQLNFYTFLPWNIISHLCIPLIILYRFHSTVCLANVWRGAYKIKIQ
ncbi:proton channel OtopLc-like [Tubulanus polymorphus]|uniref:proton channel OtopLc-like n=1 Tax=Tubulanus polymorphus TaxID=672921 RepID=UPI003DA5476F